MIQIKHAINGYTLQECWDEGGDNIEKVYVFEADDSLENDLEALCKCLYQALDSLGASGSRYDAKRIRITIEQGDKYEPDQSSSR